MPGDAGPYPHDPAAELPGPDWSIFDFLDQSEWWKPRELATAVRVDTLDPDHRRRLLEFLRRRARHIASGYFDLALLFLLHASGEIASMDAERACEEALEACENPAAWIEEQPLVVRLRELNEAAALVGAGPEWWETTATRGD